jgi:hypothetical protein
MSERTSGSRKGLVSSLPLVGAGAAATAAEPVADALCSAAAAAASASSRSGCCCPFAARRAQLRRLIAAAWPKRAGSTGARWRAAAGAGARSALLLSVGTMASGWPRPTKEDHEGQQAACLSDAGGAGDERLRRCQRECGRERER